MDRTENPHLGDYIKRGLKKRGINVTYVAKKLELSRASVYDMLKRRSLHLDRINELSEILPEGFFDDYIDHGLLFPELRKEKAQMVSESSTKYSQNVVRIQLTLDIGAVNELELANKIALIKRIISES